MQVKVESEKAGLKFNIQKLRSWHPVHHFMANRRGKVEAVTDFIFLGSKITGDGDCSHETKRHLLLGLKSYNKPRHHIKKQRHHFADKSLSSQSYGHVQI